MMETSMVNNQSKRTAFIFVWDNPPLVDNCLQLGITLQDLSLEPVYISMEADTGKLIKKRGCQHISLEKMMDKSFFAFQEWFYKNKDVSLTDRLFQGIHVLEETRYEQYCLMNDYWFPLQCPSMHDLVMKTVLCIHTFSQLIDQYQPVACFIWNGLVYPPKGLKTLCVRAGIPLFHLERGLLPNYMVIDPQGINYGGSLGGDNWKSLQKIDYQYDLRSVQLYIEKFRTEKVSIVNQDGLQSKDILSRLLSLKKTKKIILIPTQIDSDTNIIYYSPLFRTNEDVIKAMLESMIKHDDAYIIVKTHPEDSTVDTGSLQKILGDRGTVMDNMHIHWLIEASHAVVVRNSTVGLEALLFRKPVICLGKSAYSEKGFTYDVNDRESLITTIDRVLSLPQSYAGNDDKFYYFLYYLLNHYHYSLSQENKAYNKRFMEMILSPDKKPSLKAVTTPQVLIKYNTNDMYMHNLEKTIVERDGLVHNIYRSRGWRLLKKYYWLRDNVFKRG